MSSKPMTATQRYRASYPYREEYFKRNPGIFGYIWICSQCYKPIFGKKNVVIDHIVPLNKGGRNHVSNCTACCRECNSRKSDIVDYRVVKGKIFKIIESGAFNTQHGIGALIALALGSVGFVADKLLHGGAKAVKTTGRVAKRGVWRSIKRAVKMVFTRGVSGIFGVVTFPIRKGAMVSRLFFIALYALIVLTVLRDYTGLLLAWA